jgi:hypothetical protein
MKSIQHISWKLLSICFPIIFACNIYAQTSSYTNSLSNQTINKILSDSLEYAQILGNEILIEKYEICLAMQNNKTVANLFSRLDSTNCKIPLCSVHECLNKIDNPELLYGQTGQIKICIYQNQLVYKFSLFDLITGEQIIVCAKKSTIDFKHHTFEKYFNGETVFITNPQKTNKHYVNLTESSSILIVMK